MTSTVGRLPREQRSGAALPSHGRAHNLSLVLRTLHSQGAMSRAELSRSLGLTRVTVSDLVAELLQRDHVVELGTADKGRPGKPAILVDLNRTGLQIIGLDLAEADVLSAAVMDLDGTVLSRLTTSLGQERGDHVIELLLDLAQRAVEAATAPLLGIGVGTPGLVDAQGTVLIAPNLHWENVPLGALLEERTGLPTLVANDADAALMGEFTFGDGSRNTILVKIGGGVGAGVMVDGHRARGLHSAAGEIGHVTVGTDGGLECGCGRRGCLETWLATPYLERALLDADGPGRERVLAAAGERLAIALAPVVAALDLEEVVLVGEPELLEGALRTAVEDTIAVRTLRQRDPALRVRLAQNPHDAVLRGTAVLILWEQLGVA